jgi:hypothetical protein
MDLSALDLFEIIANFEFRRAQECVPLVAIPTWTEVPVQDAAYNRGRAWPTGSSARNQPIPERQVL